MLVEVFGSWKLLISLENIGKRVGLGRRWLGDF